MPGTRGKLHPKMVEAQWKPGESGNPKGRPKRASFETIVAQILDEKIPGTDTQKREALARVFVDMLLKRNGQMLREYLAREWPAPQKVENAITFPEAAGAGEILARLAGLARRKRANGDGRGVEHVGEDRTQ